MEGQRSSKALSIGSSPIGSTIYRVRLTDRTLVYGTKNRRANRLRDAKLCLCSLVGKARDF